MAGGTGNCLFYQADNLKSAGVADRRSKLQPLGGSRTPWVMGRTMSLGVTLEDTGVDRGPLGLVSLYDVLVSCVEGKLR
jgi:hypothetical protein